jgi:hypothetical protein
MSTRFAVQITEAADIDLQQIIEAAAPRALRAIPPTSTVRRLGLPRRDDRDAGR